MKMLLVDNLFLTRVGRRLHGEFSPHLGLASLAAVLEQGGWEAAILDPKMLFMDASFRTPDDAFFSAWADACDAHRADIVGFTAYGRTLPAALTVAAELRRRHPALPIVFGGPHATIVGRRLIEVCGFIDVVVRYEAERLIVPLAEALRHGHPLHDIANLVFRDGECIVETAQDPNLIDLDELPEPALHLYPEAKLRHTEMSLEAGRGCPYACTFCSTSTFFRRRYRLKSNPHLVAEMDRLRRCYGVNVFNLNHDLFGLNRKHLLEFCAQVAGRRFVWKCSMRPDTLDAPMFKTLRNAGCADIYFGIETGSPRLQREIKKRLDLDKAQAAIAAALAAGLSCTVSFITGFPDETEADQDLTLDMIGRCLALDSDALRAQLHILSPEPGSELGHATEDIHFDGTGPELDDIHSPQAVAAHPELFSVFYHFRSRIPRWRVVLASSFITSLVPELGVRFVAYLTKVHFGGQLSRLFTRLAPADPQQALHDHDAVLDMLWQRAEQVVAELAGNDPWLGDMLRLSKLLSAMRGSRTADTAQDRGRNTVQTSDEPVWLARFSHPLDAIQRQTDTDTRTSTACGTQAGHGEHWYLVHFTTHGAINAHVIPGHEALALVEETASAGFELDQYMRVA